MPSLVCDMIRDKTSFNSVKDRRLTVHGKQRFIERVGFIIPEVRNWTDSRIMGYCVRDNVHFRFVWRQDTSDDNKLVMTTVLFNSNRMREQYEKSVVEK